MASEMWVHAEPVSSISTEDNSIEVDSTISMRKDERVGLSVELAILDASGAFGATPKNVW